jgi:hypothetical protein
VLWIRIYHFGRLDPDQNQHLSGKSDTDQSEKQDQDPDQIER